MALGLVATLAIRVRADAVPRCASRSCQQDVSEMLCEGEIRQVWTTGALIHARGSGWAERVLQGGLHLAFPRACSLLRVWFQQGLGLEPGLTCCPVLWFPASCWPWGRLSTAE